METQVRTPQAIFMQPQRLMVPLFQRPYVWSRDSQWQPLWNDVARVADRFRRSPHERHYPHFLGAVVLQQVQRPTGHLQQRIIIDGQQRLTTLQLLMDAVHNSMVKTGATVPALRLERLVSNDDAFCQASTDHFKVWPTNRDRPAFNAVMSAKPPVAYEQLGHAGERMVEAHRFFSEQAHEWLLSEGDAAVTDRAVALETSIRELFQLVVIDLGVDENAQEIFETLNARGAQLTAADLIKNLVFQRLSEADQDVEGMYATYWQSFETAFWETEIAVGRLRVHRSSVFLNHWLVSQSGTEVLAREVFDRFKRYADHECQIGMAELLRRVHRAGGIYKMFLDQSAQATGPMNRLALFGYRTGVLESEVVKPLVLALLDPELAPVPAEQLEKALACVESWMVRRMLVRATAKNYNQLIAEMVRICRGKDRLTAGAAIEAFLAALNVSSTYWPDDSELRQELSGLQVFRRLRRGRLRMVLEAIEDSLRGWHDGKQGLGGERVARACMEIEHVMPRKWNANWPLGTLAADDRDHAIHTLGNLTLLPKRLNATVSNGPWLGTDGKRAGLEAHDVLHLNRSILKTVGDEQWAEEHIGLRTQRLIDQIIQVWPVPAGHKARFVDTRRETTKQIDLGDLIAADMLAPGTVLYPRKKALRDRTAIVLADGSLELEGRRFSSPSAAAVHIVKSPSNGWWFFLVDPVSQRCLRDIRRDFLDAQQSSEADDDDVDDDE